MIAPKALLPAARIALAAAMLIAASLMWQLLPTKMQSWAPIQVHGTVGEKVTGRDLAVTVLDTFLTREVTFAGDHGPNRLTSQGVWLVIVLSYEALWKPEVPFFELQADGRTFSRSLSGQSGAEQPEMPSTGPVAFELPGVPDRVALLIANQLAVDIGGTMVAPLDSQIVIPLPLVGRTPEASLNLDELGHG
jgi:hypothetical protein